jgi:hypothetical protein
MNICKSRRFTPGIIHGVLLRRSVVWQRFHPGAIIHNGFMSEEKVLR